MWTNQFDLEEYSCEPTKWGDFPGSKRICSGLPDWRVIRVRQRGRSWTKHSLFGIHEDSSFHSLSKVRSSCRVWIVWSTGGMMSWKKLIFKSGVNGTGKQRSLTKWEFQELKPIRETELHVFCDASQDAYGACAYLRRAFTDDTVECSLIAEKAVFPL